MTTITFNGLAADIIALVTITTAFVCILLGAFIVSVKEENVPEIIDYLEQAHKYLMSLWEPFK